MSDSGAGGGHNSRGQDRTDQIIKDYNRIVLEAQVKIGEDVNKLLVDAAKILDSAGNNYTHAVERGRAAFERIHGPAHHNYQRQFDTALAVQAAIIQPAEDELTRATQSVKKLIEDAIRPIEKVYADALNEAASVTGNLSLGGGISGA